jgi:hypothetical protein
MNKKLIAQIAVILALTGVVIYLTKDWFGPTNIQVMTTQRLNRVPERTQERLGPAVKKQPYTLIFALNQKCPLTSIKVVNAAELATNKFAHPLWHLQSESNSPPVKTFTYGVPLRGMKPTVKGATAEPLVRGVEYKLLLETPDQKAEHTFSIKR